MPLPTVTPSFWDQLLKVYNEVVALIDHPDAAGIATAVADAGVAVGDVVTGGVAGEVLDGIVEAGEAVAKEIDTATNEPVPVKPETSPIV